MEDSRIVDLYWARSEAAIEETSVKYGKYCYTIAHNILANAQDADETVNDTYLGAWNSMPRHRPTVLSTYLGKITRRISIDKWRSRSAEKRGSGEIVLALDELCDCVSSPDSTERAIEVQELSASVSKFLAALPAAERNVFVCRYWFFSSIKEISAAFGMGESKVKTMLFRTRKKLSEHLTKEGYQ